MCCFGPHLPRVYNNEPKYVVSDSDHLKDGLIFVRWPMIRSLTFLLVFAANVAICAEPDVYVYRASGATTTFKLCVNWCRMGF